jgi:hypothetical protein
MRFRLTYEGELRSSQRDPLGNQPNKLAEHKQHIRREFHKQLKFLWETNKFLRECKMTSTREASGTPVAYGQIAGQGFYGGGKVEVKVPLVEAVASHYQEYGYRFVPLVREEISLLCSLDILFLRRDYPGSVYTAGDLDNRIKTVLDALRRPRNGSELVGNERPREGEDPFYCLLEDDKLVTQLAIETDTLLDTPAGNDERDRRQVRLIITVELRPYDVTMFNLSFA